MDNNLYINAKYQPEVILRFSIITSKVARKETQAKEKGDRFNLERRLLHTVVEGIII